MNTNEIGLIGPLNIFELKQTINMVEKEAPNLKQKTTEVTNGD